MCMSSRRRVQLLVAILALPIVFAHAQSPQLGQPVTPEELAMIDFTVMPDGRGLPQGSGDAGQGGKLYAQHCLACHGAEGVDGLNDRLAGGHGTLSTHVPVKTVGSFWPYATTIFDFIRRAMPYNTPGMLNHDEVYALTAYLLYINGIVDEGEVMDEQSLPAVVMPNQDSFVWAVAE